jgi:hypothetical protein
MPGRAALTDVAGVKADIKSIQMGEAPSGAGDMTGEYSPIGGEGRKGADAYGSLAEAPRTRIDAEIVGHDQSGMAKKGEQGMGYGVGRTFSGAAHGRPQD